MSLKLLFLILTVCIGVVFTVGCTNVGSTNSAQQTAIPPTPSIQLPPPQVVPLDTTPATTTPMPIAITTTTTTEQPDEATLASFLTLSGTGSNYQSDTRGVESSGNSVCTYSQSGTLYIYGTIDSRSRYPLEVDMEVDIYDAPVTVQSPTLTDSIIVQPFSTTGYQVGTPYTGGCNVGETGTYNVTITGVSIVPATQIK